jgi:ethanolamine ammonia-lyase small subunit
MSMRESVVTPESWGTLRKYTSARIALGRAGHSLPTAAHLEFQLAHAQAKDAVHLPLDTSGVARSIEALGVPTLLLQSGASDRLVYLQRPDLGRQLDFQSRRTLESWTLCHPREESFDVAFVVVDGLSALAIHQNSAALIAAMTSRLRSDRYASWSIAPIAVVQQGRVAIGDEVGQTLKANAVVVLIGERPGLSSPDSLGIYMTWDPRVGRNDSQRNCISNVRSAGLSVESAAAKLHYLLQRSRFLQISGVALKDETTAAQAVTEEPLDDAIAGPLSKFNDVLP